MKRLLKEITLGRPLFCSAVFVLAAIIFAYNFPELSGLSAAVSAFVGICGAATALILTHSGKGADCAKCVTLVAATVCIVLTSWTVSQRKYAAEKAYCDSLQTKTEYSYYISGEQEYDETSGRWRIHLSPIKDGKPLSNYVLAYSYTPINAEVYDTVTAKLMFYDDDSVFPSESANGVLRHAFMGNYSVTGVTINNSRPLYYQAILLRRYISRVLLRVSGDAYPLCKAIVLGDKTSLSSEYYGALRGAGMLHVCAVSGLHVGFLCSLLFFFLSWIERDWVRYIAASVMMILLAAVTGFTPSVMRAVIMFFFAYGAKMTLMKNDRLNIIGAVFCILSAIMPMKVLTPSMLLSFSAVVGITLLAYPIYSGFLTFVFRHTGHMFSKVGDAAASVFAMSVASTLFTLPVSQYFFGSFSLMGIVSNILCLEVIKVMFSASVIAVCSSVLPLSESLGGLWKTILEYGNSFIEKVTSWFSGTSLSNVSVSWPILVAIAALMIVLLIFLSKKRKDNKTHQIRASDVFISVIITLVVLAGIVYIKNKKNISSDEVRIAFVDVGQGSGAAVISGDTAVIIDCGGSNRAGDSINSCLYENGVKKVETLVISHLHEDHANAVGDIFAAWDISEVIIPYTQGDEAVLLNVTTLVQKEGATLTFLNNDMTLSLSGVKINLLTQHFDPDASDQNENSIVAIASCGSLRAMFPADITAAAEKRLIDAYGSEKLDCDVLAVPHHGADNSSSEAFLSAVTPKLSVISVGYNTYGHPGDAAIGRLKAYGDVVTTQTLGTVVIRVDGKKFEVLTSD